MTGNGISSVRLDIVAALGDAVDGSAEQRVRTRVRLHGAEVGGVGRRTQLRVDEAQVVVGERAPAGDAAHLGAQALRARERAHER